MADNPTRDTQGIWKWNPMPTCSGGCKIQESFDTLDERIGPCKYNASGSPGASDDGAGNSSSGITFLVGSQWLDTSGGTKGTLWICSSNATNAAKWLPVEEWLSATTVTGDTIARRTNNGSVCVCKLLASKNVCASGGDVKAGYCVEAGTDVCAAYTVRGSTVCGTSCVRSGFFCGYCHSGYCGCFYKLKWYTGDPSLILYFPESRENIVQLSRGSIPPERGDGAAVFYNGDTQQIEIYKMNEGRFCSLSGELLETLDAPVFSEGEDVEEVYQFDNVTGTVVKRQKLRVQSPRLKKAYAVDPLTGKILRKEDGVEVDLQEAVELKRPPKAESLAEQIAQRQQR